MFLILFFSDVEASLSMTWYQYLKPRALMYVANSVKDYIISLSLMFLIGAVKIAL